MPQKQVFLVDLDNTLLSMDNLKIHIGEIFEKLTDQPQSREKLWEIYNQVRAEVGFVDYDLVASKVAHQFNIDNPQKILDLFLQAPFTEHLYPKAIEFVKKLKKLGKVIIFSHGEERFQKAKITNTGLEDLVGKENVIVTQNKIEDVKHLIKKLTDEGFEKITIIDDRAEILEAAYQADSNVSCIWMKYGSYNKFPPNTDCLSLHANSIDEAQAFLTSYIDSIGNFHIKKGITKLEIDQLIDYSRTDKEVINYTSDSIRFKNHTSYQNWTNKEKKYVYTLIDSQGNLMGIIWFHKQRIPTNLSKYNTTFAIRIYGNARGKGLSRKFMELVFKDFNGKGIWLSTTENNNIARKLYENFGFKEIKNTVSDKIIMTYA